MRQRFNAYHRPQRRGRIWASAAVRRSQTRWSSSASLHSHNSIRVKQQASIANTQGAQLTEVVGEEVVQAPVPIVSTEDVERVLVDDAGVALARTRTHAVTRTVDHSLRAKLNSKKLLYWRITELLRVGAAGRLRSANESRTRSVRR